MVGTIALAVTVPSLGAESLRGYLVVQGDRVLAAENPDLLFTPASVLKLVVASAALHHLGADYSVRTEVRVQAPIVDGVLRGDLVLLAAGDPSWSEEFFEEGAETPISRLAEQVAGEVEVIEGDLVVDLHRFPGRRHAPSRPQIELGVGFAAPTAGLALEASAFEVRIAPGSRVGAPGLVSTGAAVELVNEILTVASSRDGRGNVDFLPEWGSPRVRVKGEYPISEGSYRVVTSHPAPELHVGERLRHHLVEAGVEVRGVVRVSSEAQAGRRVLAHFNSPSLAKILVPVLEDSANWVAEMVLQVLALEILGEGRLDDGVELLESFLLEEVVLPVGSFALEDASGLSPYNLIAPRAVVGLLRFASRQTWGGALFDSLPSSGEGTLSMWPRLAVRQAKTGTITHTLALAGVLGDGDEEPAFFAVFLNHDLRERPEQRAEIAKLLSEWKLEM